MSTLFYSSPELVIALDKKVIFVNPNDLQIFKDVDLPTDLTKCGMKITNEEVNTAEVAPVEPVDDAPPKEVTSASASAPQPLTLQNASLAPNKRLLAITASGGGQKAVLLYECRPEHAKLISVRSLSRASSGLVFRDDSLRLLVTDKTGDCYEYDCENLSAPPRLLLGHLSIVYDLLWTRDQRHIITCDRDDKIRITNYPQTYDIHGYCLGHKEFVAGLALLADDVIASVSGDKTLRLWNFLACKELLKVELPAAAIRLAVREVASGGHFQAAILYHERAECVGVWELKRKEDGDWSVLPLASLTTDLDVVCNLCYAEERLYAAGLLKEQFAIRCLPLEEDVKPQAPASWCAMLEEQFAASDWRPEDVSAWFKKRYDNVTEYLERKKRRIEEKHK